MVKIYLHIVNNVILQTKDSKFYLSNYFTNFTLTDGISFKITHENRLKNSNFQQEFVKS